VGLNGCDFRFGVDGDHLAAIAVTTLQGELVKDGREPSVESKGKREKSFSKKAAALRSSGKSRGKNSGFLVTFNC
jgi:ATP-dependent Clp protease ATP-binding subunit ClpC